MAIIYSYPLTTPKVKDLLIGTSVFDEDDENEYSFGSEWVSALKAVVLKRKQLYKKIFYCTDCESVFTSYVKKNQNECNECPNGCE